MSENRIVGSNPHGFVNEKLLAYELNNKKISQLPINLKKFIEYICSNEGIDISGNEVIKSEKVRGTVKEDIFVEIADIKVGISVKMGSGNSVHQEKVESFIDWASLNTDMTEQEKNDLRIMIWADGTTDGSAPIVIGTDGKVVGRFGAPGFVSKYPSNFKRLSDFFNRNKKAIILRALFEGKNPHQGADYLYKGTISSGSWFSKNEYIKYFIDTEMKSSKSRPMCGNLSYQAYNASLQATESGEKKRGDIQFKYGNMEKDLEKYETQINIPTNYGTREGDIEELNLSQMMNKKQKSLFWNYLDGKLNLQNGKYHYVVKVEGKKYSQNAKKKVNCKSDNYVIQTSNEIDRNILLQNEYQLSESILDTIGEYTIVAGSGISVKRRNSSSYTITKISVNNFKLALSPYVTNFEFYIAAIVFYSIKKQVYLNNKIAEDLNIEESEFIQYFNQYHSISIKDLLDYKSLSDITTIAKEKIKLAVESNKELKEMIFSGKGWFEDPYFINYVYSHGELSDNVFLPYHIDNGSGRSKGKYYITFKPQ